MTIVQQDTSKRQNGVKHRCISVNICKDLCGTDSMHVNTGQYHPLYIAVQLSNYYNKLKWLFSFFFSYLTEREI